MHFDFYMAVAHLFNCPRTNIIERVPQSRGPLLRVPARVAGIGQTYWAPHFGLRFVASPQAVSGYRWGVSKELLGIVLLRPLLRPEIQAEHIPELFRTVQLRHLLRPEIQAELAPELP